MEAVIIAVVTPVLAALAAAVGHLYKKVSEIQEKELQCQVRCAKLEVEIAELKAHAGFLPEIVIVIDERGIICDWNTTAADIFGWRTMEVIGKPVAILVPRNKLSKHREAFSDMVAKRRPPHRGPHLLRGRAKNGDEVPIYLTYSSFYLEGKVMYEARGGRRIPGDSEDNKDVPVGRKTGEGKMPDVNDVTDEEISKHDL